MNIENWQNDIESMHEWTKSIANATTIFVIRNFELDFVDFFVKLIIKRKWKYDDGQLWRTHDLGKQWFV